MNKNLSQIVADLVEKSKGSEELSSRIHRLRDEIRKGTEEGDDVFGRFRGLLESFREIIPEEKQRYHAAIKALTTTSKLSRQEIVKAVGDQLEEIKTLEKGLMPALPWRDELQAAKTRAKQVKDEIAKLRGTITRLESEEKELLNGITAREKEATLVEKSVREFLADIRAEITTIKSKVEEFSVEQPAVQPVPRTEAVKSIITGVTKASVGQASEIRGPASQMDARWQKKCPMCGGQMNLEANESTWLCYSCAYEELNTSAVTVESKETNVPKPAASKSTIDPFEPHAASLASLMSADYQPSKKKTPSAPSQQPTKAKPCPVCRKKMYWYPKDKAWRCTSCEYERRI